MITSYHRPQTLEEALKLLARPDTLPLGGGTWINTPAFQGEAAVVDLQALGLNRIQSAGGNLEIGAMVTLQQLLESDQTPEGLIQAIKLDAPLNVRHAATLAGTLVTGDGRSALATVLLALDARLTVISEQSSAISFGEFLPLRPRGLITSVTIPANVRLAFDYVARTPSDHPIVCAGLVRWPAGRARLALGGYGKSPMLAMDGPEPGGVEAAARNAFHEAGDELAGAAYRADVAATLAKRCLESLA
jgi:CO/xanthine dehydrogenase FAD-binding subunit